MRYVLLRDLPLKMIEALPDDAQGANATWDPEARDFPRDFPRCEETGVCETCGVWKKGDTAPRPDKELRKGFCQRTKDSAWLFTLNGQRFPTITVEDGRNILLRIGALGSNVAYWLELYDERSGEPFPLTILSLDGVVPVAPVDPKQAETPVDAFAVNDLLLMPASRVEIYVRNDNRPPHEEQVYILRTKELNAGRDKWPEIQLARIVLKPSQAASRIALALNAPKEQALLKPRVEERLMATPPKAPEGCVRDLDSSKGEHRRVTFRREIAASNEFGAEWSVLTEIVQPPTDGEPPFDEESFQPPDTAKEPTTIPKTPFEAYLRQDGSFDWEGGARKHVCIHLDHQGSHKQLWVLSNSTNALHNFHIHQIKFRLATRRELEEHKIKLPAAIHTCATPPCPDFEVIRGSA